MFVPLIRAVPDDLDVQDIDGCLSVIVAFAQDANRIVSVVCELAPSDICEAPCWEFSFSIDVVALDDGCEPFRTQDRQIAANYIPEGTRAIVLGTVAKSLQLLANHADCGLIYRVTKDRDPPEKSLKKHYLLTEALENIGYSILDEGTDRYSRRFWLMRKGN
jgi:hypothetical protein